MCPKFKVNIQVKKDVELIRKLQLQVVKDLMKENSGRARVVGKRLVQKLEMRIGLVTMKSQ